MRNVEPHSKVGLIGIAALLLCLTCLAKAETTLPWRYDLRAGDHLIYRYKFQRHTEGAGEERRTEAQYLTHVLVVDRDTQGITLGFQRNRQSAELTEYSLKGKDKLARERIEFQKAMQTRPSRFSEAMEISSTGEALYPWEVARETYSHLVDALHEVMDLPPSAVKEGESWKGNNLLGLNLRWVNDEPIHGKLCHHVDGVSTDGSLKLSYWWSPESGVLEQVALDGTYSDYGSKLHETALMELESRVRGEQLGNWLGSTETSQGALQAVLLTPEAAIAAEQLTSVLAVDDPASQSLALAIASRRRITVPAEVVGKFRQSASPEVRTLAEAYVNAAKTSLAVGDECHRPVPPIPPPAKLGTTLEVAPAGDGHLQVPYLLRVPLTYREDRPSPLLVYLSGGSGFAIDAVNSAEDVVSGTDYIVLYPQAAAYWWTPEVARRFDAAFNNVLRRYNIDRDRIYITGFSNGGTGALYFAELWPQRFAAVVSMMGAGQCNETVKAGLPSLKNFPLLFLHGENDPIITPDCSTTTHAALTDLGPSIRPGLKILPKHAHDITLESDDGLTLPFFKDKIRNPLPRAVDLPVFDSVASRSYWIEILDGNPGKSDLAARVKADNTIEIHSHDVKHMRLYLRAELMPKAGDIHILWNGRRMFSGPLRDVCSLPPLTPVGDPKLDRTDTRDLTLP